METLFSQLNQLQDMLSKANIRDLIQLPEIIVVGEQSAGKSSVLQSLIEKEILPKGRGIVTRCPIRIRLNNSIDNRGEYATFTHLPDQFFTFFEIDEVIRRQSSILTSENFISEEEITVNLFSPNMTNLTLVDLPGIVSIRTEGQPEDIVLMIEGMVRKRIESSNVLILAITPAVSDLANSRALSMAKSADPEGKRTIGVFTKIDRMEKGSNALELIEGNKYPLALGYVGVICRNQQEIDEGKSLEDQFVKEMNFFESDDQLSAGKALFGMSALRSKLEVEFKNHMLATFPRIYDEVTSKLEYTTTQLVKLGHSIPEGYNLHAYSHECLGELFKEIEGLMDGTMSAMESKELIGGALFRKIINQFHEKMRKMNEIKHIDPDNLMKSFNNSGGLEGNIFIPLAMQKKLIRENVMDLRGAITKLLSDTSKEYEKFIRRFCSNRILVQYQKFQQLFSKVICLIISKNKSKTLKKLDFLLYLESDNIDPDHADLVSTDLPADNTHEQAHVQGSQVNRLEPKNTEREIRRLSELKELVQKYFSISKKSLDDQVPKYIKHFFIKRNISDLKKNLSSFINKYTEEQLASLFEENTNTRRKREMFTKNKAVLDEAYSFLQEIKLGF